MNEGTAEGVWRLPIQEQVTDRQNREACDLKLICDSAGQQFVLQSEEGGKSWLPTLGER